MTVKSKLWSLFFITCLICPRVFAANLLQVYNDALKNDPTFRAAHSTYLSAVQLIPQARANLLPGLLGTARIGHDRIIQRPVGLTLPSNTNSHEYLVTLTQPVFDLGSIAGLRQAKASVKAAAATYFAAAQDLLLRVSVAYFNVLQAEDSLRFTVAEKKANKHQLEQAQLRFKVGLDAITSVYDAQAAYDGTVAAEIGANNDVKNAREALREITANYYESIDPLKENFPLRNPNPNNIDVWVQTTTQHNNNVIAARYLSRAARDNIGVSVAQHLPVVDVFGEYQNNDSLRGGFSSNDTQSVGGGVAVTFPLYQGGRVLADTRKSQHDYETALANLDASYKNSIANTRQFFNNVVSGLSKVKADQQAVKSALSSVESNRAGYRVGTRTIVDVLLVQRDLYDKERIQAQDTYQYINSLLSLRNSAGLLSVTDLAEINTWLCSPTSYSRTERFNSDDYSSQYKPVTKSSTTKLKDEALAIAGKNIVSKQQRKNTLLKSTNAVKQKSSTAFRIGSYVALHDALPQLVSAKLHQKTVAPLNPLAKIQQPTRNQTQNKSENASLDDATLRSEWSANTNTGQG